MLNINFMGILALPCHTALICQVQFRGREEARIFLVIQIQMLLPHPAKYWLAKQLIYWAWARQFLSLIPEANSSEFMVNKSLLKNKGTIKPC